VVLLSIMERHKGNPLYCQTFDCIGGPCGTVFVDREQWYWTMFTLWHNNASSIVYNSNHKETMLLDIYHGIMYAWFSSATQTKECFWSASWSFKPPSNKNYLSKCHYQNILCLHALANFVNVSSPTTYFVFTTFGPVNFR